MKKILLLIIALPVIALGSIFAYVKLNPSVGTAIPISTAFFETSLANKITSTADTMTLVSATTKDGTTLSGFYAFVIDEGLSSEEMVNATCAATACTGMTRGLSAINGTSTVSALRFEHRRGASVKITDAPQLLILSRLLNGDELLPNALKYLTAPSWTYGLRQIVTWDKAKDYTDSVALAGAPNADTITKGVSQLSTGLQAASSTSLGSTGAALVLPASMATDTPTQSTASASKIVMTDLTGYIKQAFIKLSDAFTWTGAHIFNGAVTHNATTTISASSVTGNALVLNGVNTQWPNANSSGYLVNNGSGVYSINSQRCDTGIGTTNETATTTINHTLGVIPSYFTFQSSHIFTAGGGSGITTSFGAGTTTYGGQNSIWSSVDGSTARKGTSAGYVAVGIATGGAVTDTIQIRELTSTSFTFRAVIGATNINYIWSMCK